MAIRWNKPANYLELKGLADKGLSEVLNHHFDVFHTQAFDE